MAVLVEAISVVIRCDRLLGAFGNDWEAFKRIVPNKTLCADNELARVGFMSPDDVRVFVETLHRHGLTYLLDGAAQDLIVVDQLRGPVAACDWVEFGHISLDGDQKKRVAACRLSESTQSVVVTPEGWTFEQSLSSSFGFVPSQHIEKSLTLKRDENGLEVYHNRLTGKDVFVGRTSNRKDRVK
jgi:hypothetical protein